MVWDGDIAAAEKRMHQSLADANPYPGVQAQGQIGQIGKAFSEEGLLNHMFSYHPPNPSSGPKYENLREAARHFAKIVMMNVPSGADRTAALRKIREAVMTANAGVALDGVSF